MNLIIRVHRIKISDGLYNLIERRIYFALSRFGPRITRVSVVVEDMNGNRAGIDKRCRITIELDRLGELRVESTEADIEPAIASAADRAGRVVQRKLELRRTSRHKSSRFEGPVEPQDEIIPTD